MTFGERLKNFRKSSGFTQQQVADALGIQKATYSGYETDRRSPDLFKLEALAHLFGVTINELFGYDAVQGALQKTIIDYVNEPGEWVKRAKTNEGVITLPPDFEEFERYIGRSGFKLELDNKGQYWLDGKGKRAALSVADLMGLIRSSRATVSALAQSLLDEKIPPLPETLAEPDSDTPHGFQPIPTPQVDIMAAHVDPGQPQPTDEQQAKLASLADTVRRKQEGG